jgi:hypothetical protein
MAPPTLLNRSRTLVIIFGKTKGKMFLATANKNLPVGVSLGSSDMVGDGVTVGGLVGAFGFLDGALVDLVVGALVGFTDGILVVSMGVGALEDLVDDIGLLGALVDLLA